MKKYLFPITLIFLTTLFTACPDDDPVKPLDPPGIQRGDIEVNRMQITFTPKSGGGAVKVFEFYDKDGLSGDAPTINDQWQLNYSASGGDKPFSAVVKFFQDETDVTSSLNGLKEKYTICFRDFNDNNFRLIDSQLDANGVKYGITSNWMVVDDQRLPNNGSGKVKVTLNYSHLEKDGLCDSGVRIFEANMTYQHQ